MADPTPTLPAAPEGGMKPFNFGSVPSGPAFDVADLLPAAAAERLRKLRVRRDEAFAVTVAHAELQSLTVERQQAEQRLRQLRAHPQDHGHNLPVTDARVVAQQKLVDKLSGDLRRLNERSEARAQAWNVAGRVLTNVEDWLKNARPAGASLQDHPTPDVKLLKNESITDAIARLQRRVRELLADQHRISSSPFPSSFAKQRMREIVEQLAARGAPDVSLLVEMDRAIEWPTMRVQSEVYGAERALAFHEGVDVVGLVAFLFKEQVAKKLSELIDSDADDAAAMTHEARALAEATVRSDLLDIERQEASLVWTAQAQGIVTEHRADCSPQAILSVQIVTSPLATIGPTTSPFAYDLIQPGGGRRR